MDSYKWVGQMPESFINTRTKSDVKKHAQPLDCPILIDFRFSRAWCLLTVEGRLRLDSKKSLDITKASLRNSGRVIGLTDITSADGTEYEKEWRGMFLERSLCSMGV